MFLVPLVRAFVRASERPPTHGRRDRSIRTLVGAWRLYYERPMRFLLLALLLGFGCTTATEPANDDTTPDVSDPGDPNDAEDTTGDEETAGENDDLVVGEDACTTDADCVPAGCCHAAACVAQANAPDCTDVMCTADCQYGTLDCGGACLCHEGRCAARLSQPPEGLESIE